MSKWNYCNFLSICQISIILVWLERFQGVKFKSEKIRFKNKKRIRWKGKSFAFLLERKPESFAI